MEKYAIDSSTLEGLAEAIRKVSGTTRKYTPSEMIEAVTTILEQGVYILVDENGIEIPAVFVDNKTVFTAEANDIRIGKTAVTEAGVTEGTKEIPAYYVCEGTAIIPNGEEYTISIKNYEYTKLQALLCVFDTSVSNSVATEKVSINGKVYDSGSAISLADVTIDEANKKINLGITNDSGSLRLIRFFTYKEVY